MTISCGGHLVNNYVMCVFALQKESKKSKRKFYL